jgi:hypothetical protein
MAVQFCYVHADAAAKMVAPQARLKVKNDCIQKFLNFRISKSFDLIATLKSKNQK